jgi:hypothetical protein
LRASRLRQQPALREEAMPVVVARVVLRGIAAPAVGVEAEPGAAPRMLHGKAAPGSGVEPRAGSALAEVFQHDVVRAQRDHTGHPQASCGAQRIEPARLRREERGRHAAPALAHTWRPSSSRSRCRPSASGNRALKSDASGMRRTIGRPWNAKARAMAGLLMVPEVGLEPTRF